MTIFQILEEDPEKIKPRSSEKFQSNFCMLRLLEIFLLKYFELNDPSVLVFLWSQ